MVREVFISFKKEDAEKAEAIYDALANAGVSAWISTRDIPGGADWQTSIGEALEAAKLMILVFSSNTEKSDQIIKELSMASDAKKMVIPVRIEDHLPTHSGYKYALMSRQMIPLFGDWDSNIKKFAETVKKNVAEIAAKSGTSSVGVADTKQNLAPSVAAASLKIAEYRQLVRDALADGIGPSEQKILEQKQSSLGISAADAAKILDEETRGRGPVLSSVEAEAAYRRIVLEVCADGKITAIERTHLADEAKKLGIPEDRARAILETAQQSSSISTPKVPEVGASALGAMALGMGLQNGAAETQTPASPTQSSASNPTAARSDDPRYRYIKVLADQADLEQLRKLVDDYTYLTSDDYDRRSLDSMRAGLLAHLMPFAPELMPDSLRCFASSDNWMMEPQIKNICETLGIDATGRKTELRERIGNWVAEESAKFDAVSPKVEKPSHIEFRRAVEAVMAPMTDKETIEWVDMIASPKDVENLTKAQITEIYANRIAKVCAAGDANFKRGLITNHLEDCDEAQMKSLAELLGVSSKGRKGDVQERIIEHLVAQKN